MSAAGRWGKPKVDGADGAANGAPNGHASQGYEAQPPDAPPLAWDSPPPDPDNPQVAFYEGSGYFAIEEWSPVYTVRPPRLRWLYEAASCRSVRSDA